MRRLSEAEAEEITLMDDSSSEEEDPEGNKEVDEIDEGGNDSTESGPAVRSGKQEKKS